MRTSLPPRVNGYVLALLSIMAVALLALVLPAGARAAEACPNEQLRAESNTDPATGEPYSIGLPDCRAYEKVSPSDKQEHNVLGIDTAFEPRENAVSPNGDYVAFGSLGVLLPVEDFNSAGINPYVAERTSTGWTISYGQSPASLIALHSGDFISDFPANFSTQVDCNLSSESSSALRCVQRDGVRGPWTHSVSYPQIDGKPLVPAGRYEDGSSSDLSHIFFFPVNGVEPEAFLPQDNGSTGRGLYEVEGLDAGSPVLRLVNVDNSGNIIGSSIGHIGGGGSQGEGYQAVSSDGSTVFFSATPVGGVETLYARVDHSETVTISNPSPSQCTTCNTTPSTAIYEGASADGSKVFFLTNQQLVNADTDTTQDLYEYDFDNGAGNHIVQISGGDLGDPLPGSGAGVLGVVRTSSDGSQVYFAATGVLTTLPNGDGESAVQGADNLYDFNTNTNRTRFVADVCSGSGKSGTVTEATCPSASTATDTQLWEVRDNKTRQAQTTPDGRYMVFNTFAKLITKSTPGHAAEADEDEAQDIYRFDSQTGELIRISIGEPGFPASNNGNTSGMNAQLGALKGSTGEPSGALAGVNDWARAVSENGEYIAFLTPERLQADDVNTGSEPTCAVNPGALTGSGCDVYAWHDGVVSMISDGHDPRGIRSIPTMSADGSNVFFITQTQILPQDGDELGDLYDARIDGGFPQPPAAPTCSGDPCQGTQSSAPSFGALGSLSLTGPGNLTPPAEVKPVPTPKPVSKPKPKTLTRAQKLINALKACKKKPKKQRASCERQTRKRYAAEPKAKPRKTAKQTDRRGK